MSKKLDFDPTDSIAQRAARYAMFTGAAVAGGHQGAAMAQDQPAASSDIEEIVVTGSRIRRVDAETAVPVQIISAQEIAQTGATTIGEFIQKLPSIGGAATNPAVNNGGGDGASNVELRALGVERTLVLLNGRRYGALGNLTSAVDVNSIPVNMIERVEVLKQGAGAVYGSDAIGGVVNFITKTKQDQAELSVDYGVSSESDGQREGVSLSFGSDSDKSNIIIGFNYNHQEEISAGDREFSRQAIYFYGSIFPGGSSRTPRGRYFLNSTAAANAGLTAQFPTCNNGSTGITRNEGAPGTSVTDFRCYVSSGTPNDSFNFQPVNLILTPQERASIFTLGTYNVTDDVEAYVEFLYNRTHSGFKIAPLPFDSRSDNVIISRNSIYNPFGISFGGSGVDPDTGETNGNATFRMEALGQRRNEVETWQGQIVGGLKGKLFETGWDWDLSGGYARIDQDTKTSGYLFKPALVNAVGPSFLDPNNNNTPTCGTPTTPIAGCIPVNIFNLAAAVDDPAQAAGLKQISASYVQRYNFHVPSIALEFSGPGWGILPAGPMQFAAGFEYRDLTGKFDTDFLTQASPPLFKDCLLQAETCSGDQFGNYDVKEAYGEVLVPIFKDFPLAQSLNLTVGVRYSDYSTFGNTTNWSFKLDYKPIDTLMLRGTYSEVFRAPTIIDIYQAPSFSAETFTDPCVGLTAQQVIDNPNYALACENVPTDGSFAQPNSQIDALLTGSSFVEGSNLQPETGDVYTVGFVYEPGFLPRLSLNADYWHYSIDDLIQQPDPTYVANQCVAVAAFCNLIHRFPDGTINQLVLPTINFVSLETDGIDAGIAWATDETAIGTFRANLDLTWTNKYDVIGTAGTGTEHIVGSYDRQYGSIAEWRWTARVGWDLSNFGAELTWHYIDSLFLTDPDGSPFVCDGGTTPECQDGSGNGILGPSPDLQIASQSYFDFSAHYTLEATDTHFQLGVNNLTDNQPPVMYFNNVLNANTDVSTYDTIGRYFFASVTQKF